ncbi:hypothetical protein FOPE_06311 [Fonsecaea pedrosoi]|nr:hypothetical protein FOPE_06311 [Fonsecaea pedrosoi]
MDVASSSRDEGLVRLPGFQEPSASRKQQILQESAMSRPKGKRAGRPWTFGTPCPGTSVWDINRNLEEVPVLQGKRKDPPAWDSHSEDKQLKCSLENKRSCSSAFDYGGDPILQKIERLQSEIRVKNKNHEPPAYLEMEEIRPPLRPPTTSPITQEQLVNEVRGIYAGLVMVEKKCIETCEARSASPTKPLSDVQWQALLALHRTLLHEHHDFLLATHHPLASPALKRLAIEYDLPGRLWRGSNKAILEILRQRIPNHLEHMISYIYLSFDMLRRLDSKFPELGESWAECMHDLETYRDFLEGIRDSASNSDNGLPPSSVAYQHLQVHWDKEESSSSVGGHWDPAFSSPGKDVQPVFPSFSGTGSINWPFGASDTDSSNASSSPLLLSGTSSESADDGMNIQEEFDAWFGDLDPRLFDAEGKNKWVLMGWLHFGRHLARSFWSYRRVFKVLLLNVLL